MTAPKSPHSDWQSCRPAFIALEGEDQGRVLPDDHPTMKKILAIWETLSPIQKKAYHDVMCLNSRDPVEMTIVHYIVERFRA